MFRDMIDLDRTVRPSSTVMELPKKGVAGRIAMSASEISRVADDFWETWQASFPELDQILLILFIWLHKLKE